MAMQSLSQLSKQRPCYERVFPPYTNHSQQTSYNTEDLRKNSPPFLSISFCDVIWYSSCIALRLVSPFSATSLSSSSSLSEGSRGTAGGEVAEARRGRRLRPNPRLESARSAERTPMPLRALRCALASGENILIVWSIPETAIVGSYGFPA
jgi:hypothetical protein